MVRWKMPQMIFSFFARIDRDADEFPRAATVIVAWNFGPFIAALQSAALLEVALVGRARVLGLEVFLTWD